jgi:iron(III) transport system substrate-binding protein
MPLVVKPAGALTPLEPLLMLPEITDSSKWFDNRLWWEDDNPPYTSLGFQANVQLVIAYNKNLVSDASQFTSYRDLLNPKWKGKIVSTDIRPGTVGGVSSRFLYQDPTLGPDFLSHLYGDMSITVSADQRQLIDWLASGQFALGLFLSPDPTVVAINQGLPVAYVPGEQLKESAPLGPSRGTVNLMDKAPHPNASKLFINWLLSRDGQIAWQQRLKAPSLRTDIPKDGIFPLFVPKAGVKYVDGSTETFNKLQTGNEVKDLLEKAMAK